MVRCASVVWIVQPSQADGAASCSAVRPPNTSRGSARVLSRAAVLMLAVVAVSEDAVSEDIVLSGGAQGDVGDGDAEWLVDEADDLGGDLGGVDGPVAGVVGVGHRGGHGAGAEGLEMLLE